MATTIEAGFNILISTKSPAEAITLDSSIVAPVIVSSISIDTLTPTVGGGSAIASQTITAIGPTAVQTVGSSARFLLPVINADGTVNLAEIYYIYNDDLPNISFSAVLKVLGT